MTIISPIARPVINAFAEGASRKEVSVALRRSGLKWNSFVRLEETPENHSASGLLLYEALSARWLYSYSLDSRGVRGSFYDFLYDQIKHWPSLPARRQAVSLLTAVMLGDPGIKKSGLSDRVIHAALENPLLPQLLHHAASIVDMPGACPFRATEAVTSWVERLMATPDVRWVASWPGTEKGALGVRAPSAHAAFFHREVSFPFTDKIHAGWEAVDYLSDTFRSRFLDTWILLAPIKKYPDLYCSSNAGKGFLSLLLSASQVGPFSSGVQGENCFRLLQQAWSIGWRPPPLSDPRFSRLWDDVRKIRPQWEAWILSRTFEESLAPLSLPRNSPRL